MDWSPRRTLPTLSALLLSLPLSAAAQSTNVALNKPSSASSVNAIGFPDLFGHPKAFNGNIASDDRWASAVNPLPSNPEWLEVDLQAQYRVDRLALYTGKDDTYGRMVSFDIVYRANLTDAWQVIPGASITGNTLPAWTLTLPQQVSARYVRLLCKAGADDNFCRVREFQVFGSTLTNQPPSVFAGADLSITLPTHSVQLQGSATDADGTITRYLWTQVSGPTTATLSGATAATASANDLAQGTYVFQLAATDNGGSTSADTVSVTVNAAIPSADPRAGKLHVWNRNGTYDSAVFLPKDYGTVPGKKYPLVLTLHGRGGSTLTSDHTQVGSSPEGFIRQLLPGKALVDTFPGIVIAPNGPRVGQPLDTWWHTANVHALVLEAITLYGADPDRVTLTGLSSGASGVNDQLAYYRSTYAGAMPQAYFPPNPSPLCVLEAFPIWAAGNSDDGTFSAWNWTNPYDGFQMRLQQCAGYSGELMITVNPSGGHGGWDTFWARSDAQDWLVSQVRKAP
ncbi:discoidin domain-containing protein [Myxococcus sp. K15C18031901]|uniref:PKD domain-containing protein n=1 Tax=Myxococcus dinghuensis TaxID=2906761 RepID=UPI0020A807BC|nr:discoidin domain-containing protein [Myxococcus dinghuensis]MCP3097341.1 discoidin domain-containing protein [Myxococcus dinghuensis]